MNASLKKAIDILGGQSAAATELNCTQSMVHYWLNKAKKGIPPEYCPILEKLTGVPKEKLNPRAYTTVRQ